MICYRCQLYCSCVSCRLCCKCQWCLSCKSVIMLLSITINLQLSILTTFANHYWVASQLLSYKSQWLLICKSHVPVSIKLQDSIMLHYVMRLNMQVTYYSTCTDHNYVASPLLCNHSQLLLKGPLNRLWHVLNFFMKCFINIFF